MAQWINIEITPGVRGTLNLDTVVWLQPIEGGGDYKTELHLVTGQRLIVCEPYNKITMHIEAEIGGHA